MGKSANVMENESANANANALPAFHVSSGRKDVQGHVHDDDGLPLQTFQTSSPQALMC